MRRPLDLLSIGFLVYPSASSAPRRKRVAKVNGSWEFAEYFLAGQDAVAAQCMEIPAVVDEWFTGSVRGNDVQHLGGQEQ